MKRMISILLSAALVFVFTACGTESTAESQREEENTVSASTEEQSNSEEGEGSMTEESTLESAVPSQTGSPILIAYFSIPEDVNTEDADVVAGASIVVSEGEKLGNTQYVAEMI